MPRGKAAAQLLSGFKEQHETRLGAPTPELAMLSLETKRSEPKNTIISSAAPTAPPFASEIIDLLHVSPAAWDP